VKAIARTAKSRRACWPTCSKRPAAAIAVLRQVLQGKTLVPADELFEIVEDGSRNHGHVEAVLTAMRRLGFPALIHSRPSRQRDLVVAMVAARIPNPQSKLATTRWWLATKPAWSAESRPLPTARVDQELGAYHGATDGWFAELGRSLLASEAGVTS
jgi:hypothetical protein